MEQRIRSGEEWGESGGRRDGQASVRTGTAEAMASNTEGTASSSGAPRAVANPSSPAKSLRAVRAPAKAAAHGSGQGGKMTVTQDELEEVREAFQLFDSEGTGFLDASELKVRVLLSRLRFYTCAHTHIHTSAK